MRIALDPKIQVHFNCEHCRRPLSAGSNLVGETGLCAYCRQRITIGVVFRFSKTPRGQEG